MAKRNRSGGGYISESFVKRHLHAKDMMMSGDLTEYLDGWIEIRLGRAIARARGNKRTVVRPLDFDM
jgi:hypothetical protein